MMISIDDLRRVAEDADSVAEVIEAMVNNGGMEGIPEHVVELLRSDAPAQAKAQFLRVAASEQYELERLKVVQQDAPSSGTLNESVPPGADIDTLARYEHAISDRKKYIAELPANQELEEKRLKIMENMEAAVLETFPEEVRKRLTSPIPMNYKEKGRREFSKHLQEAVNRHAIAQVQRSQLEMKRKKFLTEGQTHWPSWRVPTSSWP